MGHFWFIDHGNDNIGIDFFAVLFDDVFVRVYFIWFVFELLNQPKYLLIGTTIWIYFVCIHIQIQSLKLKTS